MLLGHWGTTPGQNFIYTHLNRVIKKYDLDMIYVSGPGHGGPAVVSNTYLEGTYSEIYPDISRDVAGLKKLFTQFSFPGGIPSHASPECPGSIHEGGELGYSLSHAFGAVFDNPELIVACVIGDGEAETGPLATAWHSNKFLDPLNDGAVRFPTVWKRSLRLPSVSGSPRHARMINSYVMNKKAEIVRVYLPPDANCLLSVADHCLRSRHYVNVVIAGKHPAPQWLTMDAAVEHCTKGIGIWQWASNDHDEQPDAVMACAGDVPTLETLAAVSILREHLPDIRIRVINVVDLMKLQPSSEHPHGLSDPDFDGLFTQDKPIIFAFHGYPWLIHRLTYRRTNHPNLHVRGYKEEGTITTAFDMTVLNDLDRFHLVMDVIDRLAQTGSAGVYLKQQMQNKLIEHKRYIRRFGQDMPEVRNWQWSARGKAE